MDVVWNRNVEYRGGGGGCRGGGGGRGGWRLCGIDLVGYSGSVARVFDVLDLVLRG